MGKVDRPSGKTETGKRIPVHISQSRMVAAIRRDFGRTGLGAAPSRRWIRIHGSKAVPSSRVHRTYRFIGLTELPVIPGPALPR